MQLDELRNLSILSIETALERVVPRLDLICVIPLVLHLLRLVVSLWRVLTTFLSLLATTCVLLCFHRVSITSALDLKSFN